MFRFPILSAFLVACSCAHDITQPISNAPDLISFVTQAPPASACPEWIKLEGPISDPAEFVATLAKCADRAVVVEINSPGGNLFGALEIQKAIERHPHPVLCLVDGMAASAAFVTLQSCDVRMMTDRSMLMAHHASAGTRGQSQELDNLVRALRAIDRGMALRCAKRMKMDPDAYEAHVTGGKEWWLGLEDALKFHAVDFEVSGIAEALELAQGKTK